MLRNASTSLSIAQKCYRTSFLVRDCAPSRSFSSQADAAPRATSDGRPVVKHTPRATKRRESPTKASSADRPRIKTGDAQPEKRLLRPHVVSARLKKMCDEGRLDEAVTQLKNLPLDAQNVAVWNTLIRETLIASRYKLAYELYVDMKRRGFVPSLRTYTTMFGAYASVGDWKPYPKQLQHVRTLFENYMSYMEEIKERDPSSSELEPAPISAYIKILGDAGLYQDMFDVYYSLDREGPLAPNHYTFTVLLQAISYRKPAAGGPEVSADMRSQNATDAKLLWRQLLKVAEKNPKFEFDSYLIKSIIGILAVGRPADQLFAFDIVRDFLGLAKPGETPIPAQVPMSSHVLGEVLWLCNVSQKYRLGIHFFRQVAERPLKQGETSIITRHHVENVFRAYTGLSMMSAGQEGSSALETLEWMLRESATAPNGTKLMPTLATFTLVLNVCWRGGDWSTAVRTFELMSGYRADDFLDNSMRDSDPPQMKSRSPGRNIVPDTIAMSHLVRTALVSRDPVNMRQCLRIVDHFGAERFLSLGSPEDSQQAGSDAMDKKNPAFYTQKLAKDLVEIIDEVVQKPKQATGSAEETRWLATKKHAKQLLRQRPAPAPTPFTEAFTLGTIRSLTAIEESVERELTVRRPQRASR